MRASHTGSGPYCYSDSLHTCLRAAGAGAEDLPETGFLERPTTLPFGNTYRRADDPAEGPRVFFEGCDPDRGLGRGLRWAETSTRPTCSTTDGREVPEGGERGARRARP